MRYETMVIAIAAALLFSSGCKDSELGEHEPRGGASLASEQEREQKISTLRNLPMAEAFQEMQRVEYAINDSLFERAAQAAFAHRRGMAIEYCLGQLVMPAGLSGEDLVQKSKALQAAKKLLRAFPDEALPKLIDLYFQSDPVVKANAIYVLGKLGGSQEVDQLLIDALDDKTFYEEIDTESEVEGAPLRVCDMAYNQIVLRHKLKNVLRTIGNAHELEVRDYHIQVVKSQLW